MKRCFVALLLFAAAAVAHAVTPPDEDAGKIFRRLWDANQIHKGLNLILTYPNGQKLWADVKAENGYAILNWVLTDAAGKTIPTVIFGKNGQRQMRILSEVDKCKICDPDGKNCKIGDCPRRVPCCPNRHWCCIK